MQQKAQLIATLAHSPDLLVVDEPFSGLDPLNTRLVKQIIQEQADAGKTVVMSTHQMYQVEAMCNRIVLIDRGHSVLYGRVDEIKRRFAGHAVSVAGRAILPTCLACWRRGRRARTAPGIWPCSRAPSRTTCCARWPAGPTSPSTASRSPRPRWTTSSSPSSRASAGRRPMRKAWLVAKHEYLTMVRKRSFVLATLAFPVLIAAFLALTIFLAQGSERRPAAGLRGPGRRVDRWRPASRRLDFHFYPLPASPQPWQPCRTAASRPTTCCRPATGRAAAVRLTALSEAPPGAAQRAFDAMLRASLLAGPAGRGAAAPGQRRHLTVRSIDGRREFSQSNFVNLLLPFVAGFFFVYAVLSSAGYLLQAVTTEKENRTVEIMATTLSPDHLIAGKAAGLLAVALTQLAVWVAAHRAGAGRGRGVGAGPARGADPLVAAGCGAALLPALLCPDRRHDDRHRQRVQRHAAGPTGGRHPQPALHGPLLRADRHLCQPGRPDGRGHDALPHHLLPDGA